jgi:type I site-specific restriction endonuclease
MMQRILEEACYDFASRWMRNILNENNWTCSEAVELSMWRKVLPPALSPNVIVPVKDYSLEDALTDAVRIRNSAVHRHLCDNIEIRRMASQAQDLMSMFSDVTRQTKFHRLRDELDDWDAASQQDLQAARSKLQEALQEISERPMDDMDWAPNVVSLQEITTHAESLLEIEEHYVDEMELD